MLKTIRHNRGITQRVLGDRIYRSSSQVARYEKRAGAIPLKALRRLEKVLNVDKLLLTKETNSIEKKSRIVLVGRSDAGKSTLGNFLLGKNVLPTGYGPLTKLITQVHHISEKPNWASGTCQVFRCGFEPHHFREFSHTKQHLILETSNLKLRQYTHRDSHLPDAKYLIVFSSSPILRYCSVVDLPGFDHSNTDTDSADEVILPTDCIIYLSSYIGFMSDLDIQWLVDRWESNASIASQVKSQNLNSLFIVLTHAYSHLVRDDEIKHCFKKAAERFKSKGLFPKHSCIHNRMFPFLREMQKRNLALETGILRHLAELDPL